jgi:Peptidase M76 family
VVYCTITTTTTKQSNSNSRRLNPKDGRRRSLLFIMSGSGGEGASASCAKCVKVLRELISGLQDDNQQQNNEGPISRFLTSRSSNQVPPPLTLLKAIADPPTTTKETDKHRQPKQNPNLKVEDVEDGVRLTIPVEATMPHLLRRWTKIVPVLNQSARKMTTGRRCSNDNEEEDSIYSPHHLAQNALATSANSNPTSEIAANNTNTATDTTIEPLTIELKCRKCASTGPEGGARAFLMGPQPLSVILCHNRIDSEPAEINEILTHELTHLYDVQTLQLDLQECESLAYSEVRAAKSAECRNWSSSWQPYCVKQKAMNATHNLYPREARSCVNKVFETAFNDNRPFQQQKGRHFHDDSSDDASRVFHSSPSDR